MSGDTDTTTASGLESRFGWPVGGALGGGLGAVAFGLLLWVFDPAVFEATIPGMYGLEPAGMTGWSIHVLHGALLGVGFGFLVTRKVVLGVLQTDVETPALARVGLTPRLIAAGAVFGLAIWAFFPLIVLPMWVEFVGAETATFPTIAAESLVGHVLFGTVLGTVFASTIDLTEQPAETDVLEDETHS